MQIRCAHCTKTIALAETGELPPACPHCAGSPGPGALGPYDPVRLIAAGGMGEVYLARHRELGTEVALKVLPAMPLDTAAAVRERFAREARLTARVKHPGVVRVLGNGATGDRPYLVLEYVAGQTLRQLLQRGPLPTAEAARVAAATADVLAAAHQEGVLHRDVKPDNVMVTPDGEVRVLDFGIARCLQDGAPITRTGEIVGTPEYMAPEQLLDGPEATTERTDVHALGVLLYELLTGRSPFHGANLFQALKLVESLVPQAPSAVRSDVPQALDRVVLRAAEKQPADRFASAAEFAAAVRTAVPALAARTGSRPSERPRSASLLLAGAAALLAAAIVWQTPPRVDPKTAAGGTAGVDDGGIARELAAAQAAYEGGSWCKALVHAERAADTGPAARLLAQRAFVLHHLAWPLAAGLPAWLARTEERQRSRLFGDAAEPGPADHADLRAMQSLLSLDAATVPSSGDVRLRWLQLCLREDPRLAQQLAAPAAAGDALAALLRLREVPPEQRAAAFADCAQRLPIDGPEHWLARTIERHLRGDAAGGTQAAENAWLAGGGELAVLLDAALQVLQVEPDGARLRRLPARSLAQVRHRLATADALDAPAAALLRLSLQPTSSAEFALARQFPADGKPFASAWFVATAAHNPEQAGALLLLAACLGARPDYAAEPWQLLGSDSKATIDAECQRGR